MKAVIMAGGEGTRLRPLTCCRPKPMVPVANRPVMEHIINLLKKHNIRDIAVTLQYMPGQITEYFGDGREFGVRLEYFIERTPLGTAGSISNAASFIDGPFMVISGDALTDIDLNEALEFHISRKAFATIILKRVEIPLEYGVVITDDDGRIVRFLEKPGWAEVFSDTVNTGIYILSKEILSYIRKNSQVDFSKDIFPVLLKEKARLYGFVTPGYWCDIGDLQSYMQANFDVMNGCVNMPPVGKRIADGIFAGDDCIIDKETVLKAPCIIGNNVRISKGTVIDGYSVIGNNVSIGSNSIVKRSVLLSGSVIDSNVQLKGALICSKAVIMSGATVYENSVVADGSLACENTIIKPNVRIWPGKRIEAGSQLGWNLVWGSNHSSNVFGSRGIRGRLNVEITPENASRLAAAFGSLLGGKGLIAVGTDDESLTQIIRHAVFSGLLSSGAGTADTGKIIIPAFRHAIRFFGFTGGIHIHHVASAADRVCLDFFDHHGLNIDRAMERKIENAYIREDFTRCDRFNAGNLENFEGFDRYYIRLVQQAISCNMKFRIIIFSSSGYVCSAVSSILVSLGNFAEYHIRTGNEDLRSIAAKTVSGGFDLGVVMEKNCERMIIISKSGKIVQDDRLDALITFILLKTMKEKTIVLPVHAPGAVEEMALSYGSSIVRSKCNDREVMKTINDSCANEDRDAQLSMRFDAPACLVRILDFMNTANKSFDDILTGLPVFHIKKTTVECPWNKKGTVIRRIIYDSGNNGKNNENRNEVPEGVRIMNERGRVLVLPDSDSPVCNIIGESYSEEYAQELADIYAKKVRDIQISPTES